MGFLDTRKIKQGVDNHPVTQLPPIQGNFFDAPNRQALADGFLQKYGFSPLFIPWKCGKERDNKNATRNKKYTLKEENKAKKIKKPNYLLLIFAIGTMKHTTTIEIYSSTRTQNSHAFPYPSFKCLR